MAISTEEKKKQLSGVRYRIVNESIEALKKDGIDVTQEMEIHLHWTHLKMIRALKHGNK